MMKHAGNDDPLSILEVEHGVRHRGRPTAQTKRQLITRTPHLRLQDKLPGFGLDLIHEAIGGVQTVIGNYSQASNRSFSALAENLRLPTTPISGRPTQRVPVPLFRPC